MGETITAIEEVHGVANPNATWGAYDGFKITTDRQTIQLLIGAGQDCCEEWGYFLTEQDAEKFVGAELRGVKLTDTNRSTRNIGQDYTGAEGDIALDSGDVMFVDLETDRGPLQFVAYNAHNGYYGHTALVVSEQLRHEVTL